MRVLFRIMRWKFHEAKDTWSERHLETNQFSERQRAKLNELNLVRTLADELSGWMLSKRHLSGNSKDTTLKFTGSLRKQWAELASYGEELLEKQDFEMFWTDKFKFEMGLNALQLIFDSLVLVDDRSTFMCNARDVSKALTGMRKGAEVWLKVLREIRSIDDETDHGQGFFDRNEVLISSTVLSYQSKIFEKVEHNLRKIADLFF